MSDAVISKQKVYSTVTHGVPAWLVVDRTQGGLAFGGFRFTDTVDFQQVSLLASTMSWKLAAHGLPVGGAKAGLCCRPDHPKIDAILKDLSIAWYEPLSERVILGKDMGASDVLLDKLYAELGKPQLHLVQARSPISPGRIRDLGGYVTDMTGLGAVIAAEAAVGSLNGKKILIQGAGIVGVGIAMRAKQHGAIVIGMSDVNRAAFRADGLPVAEQVVVAREAGRPFDLSQVSQSGGHWMPSDEMLAEKADILFLAAGSHVVTEALSRTIQSSVVIEVSNFGLTEEANCALFKRGVLVIPDMISSSSSAAMTAYQIAQGNSWKPASLWDRIELNIRRAVKKSMERSSLMRISVREAYMDLHKHVVEADQAVDASPERRVAAMTAKEGS
jgi:glutamate dehydrogenase (NAD(P)+)